MNPTWQIDLTNRIFEQKDPQRSEGSEKELLLDWAALRGINMIEHAEERYWDGKGNLIIRDSIEEISHELGHWLVASTEARVHPEFALGLSNPPCKRVPSVYTAQDALKMEDRANIASWFLRMDLGIFDYDRVERPHFANHVQSFYGHLTWMNNRNVMTKDGILVN
jgi:hypothetical protein